MSRYPTRSSRVDVPQLLVRPSGSHTRPILRPATRSLMEARDFVAKTDEFQFQHSFEAEDVKPSPSTGFPSQHEIVLDGISQPPIENDVVLLHTSDDPSSSRGLSPPRGLILTESASELLHEPDEGIPKKSRTNEVIPTSSVCLSPTRSLNLTEFARGLGDDSDDETDEVESAPDPAYGYVYSHRVKTEIVHLIRAIFGRYGDITSECSVKSREIISFLLERLADVYQRLEQRKLPELTRGEIDKMMDELRFLEAQKLNIRWLLEKLESVSETKIRFQKYLMAREEEAKCALSCEAIERTLEMQRRHLFLIEKKIAEVEESKAESEARGNECKQMALEIKRHLPSLKDVKNQSLVHGLR